MQKVELTPTITIQDYVGAVPVFTPLRKFLELCIYLLGYFTRSRILVPAPAFTSLTDPSFCDIEKITKTITVLRSAGILDCVVRGGAVFHDEPKNFRYNAFSPLKTHVMGYGRDFVSEENALWKSLGECVERHIWSCSEYPFRGRMINATLREMQEYALDIYSLAGFTDDQKRTNELLRFDEHTKFNWLLAKSITTGKRVLCPAQLVSGLYAKNHVKKKNGDGTEPLLRWCITTGLATRDNIDGAIVKGILEVIERDAFMISYLNKLSPPRIDLEHLAAQDEEIAKILKDFARYNLDVYALSLPTDFKGVYVISTLIVDRTGLGPSLTVGASAYFDVKTAFLNAISEAISVRYALKNSFKQEIDLNNLGNMGREIFWAKSENLSKIDFFFIGEKIRVSLGQGAEKTEKDTPYFKEKRAFLAAQLQEKKLESCYVELTVPAVKKLFRTVSVVIPELQPLHLDESIPYLGGRRLHEVPLALGYQPAVTLNKEPHPFP